MAAFAAPFKDYWASTVHPAIKDDFQRLLRTTPMRMAEKEKAKAEKKEKTKGKDPVREKITSVLEEVREKGERRNAYMNLAWTGPVDNSFLQEKISLGKVENMAADMFLRSLPTNAAAETAPESQEAADDAEAQPQSKGERRAVEWQIPERVEKGFEIPILIGSSFSEPDIGKFKRLGMDVVVNAVWLAFFWAKQEGSSDAATALEQLILDWPFDFIHIQGSSTEEIEENKFKWAVNMTARVERLRDFVGLENANLLRIVARTAEILRDQTASSRKPLPEQVQDWLQQHVRWGLLHCPDTKTGRGTWTIGPQSNVPRSNKLGLAVRHPVHREASEFDHNLPCGCNSGTPGRPSDTASPLRTLAQSPSGCVKFYPKPEKLWKFFKKHAKGTPRLVGRCCVLCRPGEGKDAEKCCQQLYHSPRNWVLRFNASVKAPCPGTKAVTA